MSRPIGSSIRVTKTRTGTRVRATGAAAQALFDAMCKAHSVESKPAPQQPAKEKAHA